MATSIPVHSEPDAIVRVIGALHMEGGVLVCGDTNLQKKIAALAGVLGGGRQFGIFEATFTKITVETTTSDQSMGLAFAESSEPKS